MICRFIALLALSSLGLAQTTQYTDFTGAAGLVYNGAAAVAGSNLRVSAAAGNSLGSAFLDAPVVVEAGFDTTFEFEFSAPSGGGADGMTFVVHNDARGTMFLGNGGSALGYSGYTTSPAGSGLTNALVFEFDTWASGADGVIAINDASVSELSVHTGGAGEVHHSEGMSLAQIDTVSTLGIDLGDAQPHTARIVYVPGQLEVFLDGQLAISVPYDIGAGGNWVNADFGGTPAHAAGDPVGGLMLMGGAAWVGFTASTGGAWENHDVRSWTFTAGASAFGLCNGDGGDQLGCTNCPCGNNTASGTVGGCINGSGAPGVLQRLGSSSMTTASLRFELSGAPAASACRLVSGSTFAPTNPANPCFGTDSGVQSIHFDGLRCVVQGILRHGTRLADSGGEVGQSNDGWGSPSAFTNFSAFSAGSTRAFQAVFSDSPSAGCGTGANTTQAIAVTMTP